MHILELPSFFPPYGGLFCIDQSVALQRQGNTVRVAANVNLSARLSPVTYLFAHTKPYMLEMRGIEVMRKELRGIPFSLKKCSWHWVKTTQELVDKYVEKYGKPDIIHAHCCKWAGYVAMKCSEKYNVPYVITEHLPYMILAEEFGKEGADAWQLPYLKEAYKKASMVIPVSEELVDDIACFIGKDYKWKFISNTIDIDFFAYRKRDSWKGRPFVLCCVADFVVRKGYDVMLATIKDFVSRYGIEVKIVIAGNNTDSKGMKELVEKYGLTACTELCGKVDKYGVRDVLYRSDCFFFATRSEVQPLVVLEAMSTGMPVVTTEAVPRSERINGGCFVGGIDKVEELRDLLYHVYNIEDFDGVSVSKAIADLASPEKVGKQLTGLFKELCEEFKGAE